VTAAGDQTAILQSKLFRAPLPKDHVLRPHLLERLQLVKQHPLTIVSAPAGYGKSVLLRSWSQQCDCQCAWLSLDEEDNDLALFESYFLAALNSVIPSIGNELIALSGGARLPPPPVFVDRLFDELSLLKDDIVLMIDDYGVVANDDVHEFIAELMNQPHPRLHLVLITRHDPPLPLHEWRARDQLLELRSVDLRFSLEETRAFLQQAIDVPLDEETIVALNAKTEGWAAGLRLAILPFSRIEDFPGHLDKISGSSAHIRDYLASQVLSSLPAETQLFLLQTSILNRLSASLCQAVIMLEGPIINAQSTLLALEAANVFTIPLDDSQQWFRYHHLFGEFLQLRLHEGYSSEVIAALHGRASDWFGENGFIEEALHHAMAAGEMETAVEIVAANRHALSEMESYQRLAHWLNMFPPQIVDGSPDLLLIQARFAQTVRFDVIELNQLVGKIDALLGHLHLEAQRAQHLSAENESFRGVVLFYFDPDLGNSLACFRNALEVMPQQWYVARNYCWIYGAVTLQMMGDSSGAHEWIKRARREDLTATDGPRVRNAIAEAMVHKVSANLTGLIDIAEFMLRNTPERDYWETRGWSNHFLASALYERNDLDSAQRHAQEVFKNRDHHPAANVDNDIILVRILQARGKPTEAREMLEASLDYATQQRSSTFTLLAQSFQVELAVLQGRAHEVTHWAEQAYANLHLVPMHTFYMPELTIPKVLLAAGTPDGRTMAAECLQRLHEHAQSTHNVRVMIEVLALEALLHAADDDEKTALDTLEQSLALARPGGYVRLFVDLGPEMADLLRRKQGREPFAAYIASILQAFGDPSDHAAQPDERKQLMEPLTDREAEILQLLAKRYSNKEIAAELVISPATVKGHTINLYQKLSVHNRRDAVSVARALRLIPSPN
jgi:LuxR family maltose regulon positive regulatory protein